MRELLGLCYFKTDQINSVKLKVKDPFFPFFKGEEGILFEKYWVLYPNIMRLITYQNNSPCPRVPASALMISVQPELI